MDSGKVCGRVVFPSLDNCSNINMSLTLAESLSRNDLENSRETQSKIIGLYIMGTLCLFGIIGNVLSVIGLRRDKERRETLFLLQCLAVIDGLYLLTALFRYPLKHLMDQYTFQNIQLGAFPLLKSFQTICIWTMVLVTIDRYIYVCHPLRAQVLFTRRSRRIWAVAIFVAGFIYNLPRFFDSCISTFVLPCSGVTIGGMMFRPLFTPKVYSVVYRQVLYILFLYVAPLTILTYMNCSLIKAIRQSRRRHANCIHSSHPQDPTHDNNATVVLVIIVIAFIVCEAPEPVIHSVSAIEYAFHVEIFSFDSMVLYAVSDLLMLVNSSINFLIYVVFGRRFRGILKEMFKQNFAAATLIFSRQTQTRATNNPMQSFPKVQFTHQPAYVGVKV